jgi:DNA invertase Pin-like site-specific DNA recombinase
MNAWALLVVSSDIQAESLAHQRAWAEETAKAKGWTLDRVFEGVSSGKDGPRRLLREMVGELRKLDAAARPGWLLMIRADRIGRGRIAESQIAQHELIDLGVRIWTRNDGELKLDSAMDQLIAAVRATTAAFENEVRVDKARAIYRRKRAAGLAIGNRRPYGLAFGPDGRDVVAEDQAEIVRMVFQLRIDGHGYTSIARRVAPIAPPYRFKDGERAVHWLPRRVRDMLELRTYVPLVIDEVTFHRAQLVSDRLPRQSAQAVHSWPLTGAVRCYCGGAVMGKVAGKSGRFRYYGCYSRWNHDNSVRLVRAEKVEQQFVALLAELKDKPHLIAEAAARVHGASPALIDRAITEASANVASLNRQRERVWEMNNEGKVRDEDVQDRLDALARRRDDEIAKVAELEAQRARAMAAVRRVTDTEALIAKAHALYGEATSEEQRALARAVSLDLGGLCVEADGTLTIRWVRDPTARRRAQPKTAELA